LVDFTITTTIPSYSAANESVTFDVIDTIVNGLDYAPAGDSMAAPAVTVGGVAVSAGEDTYEFIYTEGTKTFTISFDSAYILGLADETEEARKVVITYDAVVTDEAIAEVAENALSLKYTTAQGEVTTEGVEKDKEYVYTVTLEGVFDKIDESGAKLSGAIFELYEKADASEAVVDEELQTGYVELEDGKYGKGIINNSKTKIVLNLEDEEAMRVQSILHLSEAETMAITHFERGNGLISTNNNNITVEFKASELEKELITTDRLELKKLLEKEKQRQQILTANT